MKIVTIKGRKFHIVRTRTEAAFNDVYLDWEVQISKNAWTARVPGWEKEDVEAEMGYCLWVAFKTHDKTRQVDFGVHWWSIWLNHRATWIRSRNAMKRAAEELPYSQEELIAMSPIIYPGQLFGPPTETGIDDELAYAAWSLLALGYLPSEVQGALHLSNRRYYTIIDSWKTEGVYKWLTNQY